MTVAMLYHISFQLASVDPGNERNLVRILPDTENSTLNRNLLVFLLTLAADSGSFPSLFLTFLFLARTVLQTWLRRQSSFAVGKMLLMDEIKDMQSLFYGSLDRVICDRQRAECTNSLRQNKEIVYRFSLEICALEGWRHLCLLNSPVNSCQHSRLSSWPFIQTSNT